MPYFVPGCEFSEDRHEHDHVAERIVTSACHQLMPGAMRPDGEHVGRDAVGHRDPQRRVRVRRPGALLELRRREVLVVERRIVEDDVVARARRGRPGAQSARP